MFRLFLGLIVFGLLMKYWIYVLVSASVGGIFYWGIKCYVSTRAKENSSSKMNEELIESTKVFKKTIEPKELPGKKGGEWIPPGKDVSVLNYAIPNGMVYIGEDLRAANGYDIECSLINPKLPVSKKECDYKVRMMDYWPSYSKLSPEARKAYLCWLATGKLDRDADIGNVFLYYYGLERRILSDIGFDEKQKEECEYLKREIQRLLEIYGENKSFCGYASSLLTYVNVEKLLNDNQYVQKVPNPTYHVSVPLELKVGLGRMARDKIPLPAEWALAWYFSMPNPPSYAKTAAKRCKIEFEKLFREEYTNQFGAGIVLASNKTQLSCNYYPASSSLKGLKTLNQLLDLPDVTVLTNPLKKIEPIIEMCHEKLEKYSRYLGRNPEKKNSISALVELPVSLWSNEVLSKMGMISDRLTQEQPLKVALNDLVPREYFDNEIGKKVMNQILDVLEFEFCLGLEPDCRIGGWVPTSKSAVFIFKIPDSMKGREPSIYYKEAILYLHFAMMVSQVDGGVSKEELEIISLQVNNWANLNEVERFRLKSHFMWMATQKLNLSGMKKRVSCLSESRKEALGKKVAEIAASDGMVAIEEVRLIERIYKILELDSTYAHETIHQSALEPVTVLEEVSHSGFLFPKPELQKIKVQSGLQIDMEKVNALREKSAKVTEMLTDIFMDGEELVEEKNAASDLVSVVNEGTTLVGLWGLSEQLTEFVRVLVTKEIWGREEIQELVDDRGIMLEGALEEINEATFEQYDQALIENEDPFEINQEIVRMMTQ